ncbi:MAG: hypothetical protein RML12_10670 [Xanthomonadales bacterium]|nr:hypothetical protein [Xanthomonadales bacterium]
MSEPILAIWGERPPGASALARLREGLPPHELWYAGPAEGAPGAARRIGAEASFEAARAAVLAERGPARRPVVLLAADATLPPGWFPRLAAAARELPDAVLSPLDPGVAELSPLATEDAAELARLDAIAWRLGGDVLLPAERPSPALSWWAPAATAGSPVLLLTRLVAGRAGTPSRRRHPSAARQPPPRLRRHGGGGRGGPAGPRRAPGAPAPAARLGRGGRALRPRPRREPRRIPPPRAARSGRTRPAGTREPARARRGRGAPAPGAASAASADRGHRPRPSRLRGGASRDPRPLRGRRAWSCPR